MPLLLLVSLILACLPLGWPPPPSGSEPRADALQQSAILTASVVVGLLLVARAFSLFTVSRVTTRPDDREAIGRAHGLRRLLFVFLNLGGFWLVLLPCGWGWAARELLAVPEAPDSEYRWLLPGAEFLVIAPYLIVMVGSWAAFFDAERALHRAGPAGVGRREFWSRWGYVGFLLRHQVLVVFLPVLLTITQLSLLRTFPEILSHPWAKLMGFAGLFLFILVVPSLLPLLLGLRPMEPGPLRDRLAAAAKRLGVRYRNLYVWDTRGNVATAMVAGLTPRLRQIVFTDLLLATLTEDEIEAVFGHEVGHVRHGHLLYYAGFLILSFLTLGAVYRAVELSAGLTWHTDYILVFSVLLTFTYLFLVFGFVSRRCERQADVFGCKAVSCLDPTCVGHLDATALAPRGRALCPTGVSTFVAALAKVEAINGSARGPGAGARRGVIWRVAGVLRFVGVWVGTWQHGTIAKRIEFLQALDPAVERRFQRRVLWMRWGLLVLLVAGVAAVAAWRGWRPIFEGL